MQIDASKLAGKTIYLKELRQEHIPTLKILAHDPRIWDFTKSLLINETFDDQFDKYMAIAQNPNGDGGFGAGLQKTFVIFRTSDDTIIGMTRYYGLNETHKRTDIGYTWYIPEVWKMVYNKECKLLLLQYAFEVLDLNR